MVLNIAKDSITRSPLYTIYGEMLSGITVVRAFGSSTKFLRDMLCLINAVCSNVVPSPLQYSLLNVANRTLHHTTGCGAVSDL